MKSDMRSLMKNRINYLYLAFLLELLLVFYLRNRCGFLLSPVLILLSGIFLSVFPFFLLSKNPSAMLAEDSDTSGASASDRKWAWGLFGILSCGYLIYSYILFKKYPVDIQQSDIIPFINDVMVQRFLSGENVYAPVHGFNIYQKEFTPNYLPFQWLPFVVSGFLHIDHRWMVAAVLLLSVAFYTLRIIRNFSGRNTLMMKVALPFAVVFSIYCKQGFDAANTVEMMIMGYYLFLGSSLFVNNALVRAIGLVFPVLSRYSFLFWLPLYFYSLFRRNMRMFLVTGFALAGLVLLFFVLPFVLPHPQMLRTFNDVYMEGALQEWDGQAWQQPGDKPFQLFQGMGFASWFYRYHAGSLPEKIVALKNTLLVVSLLCALLPLLFYRKLTRVVSPGLVTLLGLKFCLTVFYSFILVPYVYLFWVPVMMSVLIISRVKEREKE